MKIVLERKKCIGCGACVNACPRLFQMETDGKAGLKEGKEGGVLVTEEPGCAKKAAEVCPVQIIKIKE